MSHMSACGYTCCEYERGELFCSAEVDNSSWSPFYHLHLEQDIQSYDLHTGDNIFFCRCLVNEEYEQEPPNLH